MGELGIPVTVTTNRGDVFSDISNVTDEKNSPYPDKVFIPSKNDRKKFTKNKLLFSEHLERVFHVWFMWMRLSETIGLII